MSTYGLINNVNNAQGVRLLIEAGINQKDMYLINNLGLLVGNLKMGDKVITPGIEVFMNTGLLYQAIKLFEDKHVSFTSLSDKIKFTNNSPLKDQYSEFILKTILDEKKTLLGLEEYYRKYINTQVLIREVDLLCLRTMSRVFNNNGLLKR